MKAHRNVLEELKMVAREARKKQMDRRIHNHFMEEWGNFMGVLQRRREKTITGWGYNEACNE